MDQSKSTELPELVQKALEEAKDINLFRGFGEPEKPEYDWEGLKAEIIAKGGVRNTSLIARLPQPWEGTCRVLSSSSEGIYPVREDIFLRSKRMNTRSKRFVKPHPLDMQNLQENPAVPSIVANNTADVWEAMNAHNKTFILGDETDKQVVFEFKRQGERSAAIIQLNMIKDAWPPGYKPEIKD